ncbi:LON peptidase substrate-binding domain-containing protein [Porphyrobacter sp. CACIAM 03H1]|jgi:Lon protease-like protein|uniref:LON peptidase substrate-binding domain-containing protein n=1 Tax=Porphyrobacter sp. CACIAM 03H1 TaxID=2003315 RepID=UPI000B5A86C7|nr:LON peptidase substrate-binding domain-containing protein [Porphyrobacter sp. CACIAM 03H1]ASJ90107.1 ATP-dependent protease [Porphyrobacter sp. CACIAM 03H1]
MTKRLAIFPLTGAVLFPGMQLPLHIFEPRYRAMVGDALIRDRLIAMIQPQRPMEGAPLYRVGCVGRIGEIQAMDDGRYNLILEGTARFRLVRELEVATAYRQVEADIYDEAEDETLTHAQRGGFEREARAFADAQGYSVDWDSVERLDDRSLINGVSQIAPFDPASKQALLEAETLTDRCELLVQLMQFYGRHDGGEEIVTLQ